MTLSTLKNKKPEEMLRLLSAVSETLLPHTTHERHGENQATEKASVDSLLTEIRQTLKISKNDNSIEARLRISDMISREISEIVIPEQNWEKVRERLKSKGALSEAFNSNVSIKVVGVGGAGGNIINRMIDAGLKGVEFIAANTDHQALNMCKAPTKLALGNKLTRGLGAGSNPTIGRNAALEDTNQIIEALEGSDLVFLVAGLGGGTGTGASPVIGALAVELNALTIAVVTTPFAVEGRRRKLHAEQGLVVLRDCADTVIVIPNSQLLEIDEKITFLGAFQRADEAVFLAVRSIYSLLETPGLLQLDFADIRSVMHSSGEARIGIGTGHDQDAVVNAMKAAINSRLLGETWIRNSSSLIINITGPDDMSLDEIERSISHVTDMVSDDADIVFGTIIDDNLENQVQVVILASSMKMEKEVASKSTLID